ncbi:MAG: 2-isopropylmalate synthase [Candidatus Lambdaproteobacteria bacterium RIFOXYD1_FULL_56_27]|uniref:2-isopropylmalate synthase n=1 Tax=Candidatus Lambdaproteobacteria bacterium RIFOXYD2_FULL_56_26 TaxID=1817773 RepID=A0A1F6GR75_9PROT|nr:MAG: 2-isopropylmalate synthase [Candidatus Lambdaproteobacteria bacterium RIFOXYC1_FULL_56_13]OGH00666.1 MAG: 2-isopropylmalate synthase [Candidatus Lambdaproteobacteria bacterium RIFOXYD2_FULL_56_26]OGH07833.1 MAG: 2-isopropylmalate synthase [Candidatus Lambdaproteobacteria bacterium RIFOXYD1_FULL_56_27]
MTHSLEILDTTLRDGEQTQGVAYTAAEKTNIAKALLEVLQVDRIEVASARVSEGEKRAVTGINQWAKEKGFLDQVEVLGFVDQTLSVDWIVETGGKVINLLTKGSLKHCREQLKKTPEQHWAEVKSTIGYAKSKGLKVNVYLEDWSNGYADSRDYVFSMMEALLDQPIHHFMLPDTLGVMGPEEVYAALGEMTARFPTKDFDFHPHNDYGLATANVLAAVKAGVKAVHCTINCLGERAGNASLSEVVVNLKDRMGLALRVNESELVTLSRMVENFSGKRIADNAPVVGDGVFTQTAGIHADGDAKGGLYQSRLRPERFGRKHTYALGKMAGKASLARNLEELGLQLTEENQKKVLKRIIELGDSKAEITPEDLEFVIADVLESAETEKISLLNCTITSGLELESTVSVRVAMAGEVHLASGIGNGGFDAFIQAMKKATGLGEERFPELLDYEIRIPKGGKSSALTECIITWQGPDRPFKTRGVHHNQVFAAVHATMKMLNLVG